VVATGKEAGLNVCSVSLRFLDTGSIPLFSGIVIHTKEHEYHGAAV